MIDILDEQLDLICTHCYSHNLHMFAWIIIIQKGGRCVLAESCDFDDLELENLEWSVLPDLVSKLLVTISCLNS
jgi:hypothetical protein